MGCLFRLVFLLVLAAVVGIPGAAVLMGVERTPLLQRQAALRPAELRQATMLAMRFGPTALQPGRQTSVTLSEPELNLLIQGWTTRVPKLAARAGVASIGVAIGATATLPVPENPLGRYVNIRALVVPSSTGLEVDRLLVGHLDVPSPLIRPLLVFLLSHFGTPGQGDALYSSVRAVRVAGRRVAITLVVPQDLATGLAGGSALPATGNPMIDALLRRASPAERQRVIDAAQRHLGSDPSAVQRALQAIQRRFGGQLPPIDDNTVRQLQQQFGGDLPSDPAARQQAIDALRQRGISVPGSR